MNESNGSLKAGNGAVHANGNGIVNGHSGSRARLSKSRQGFMAWTFGIVARLATWAAILTILFRCPPSLEACDENAPYICKPYFQVKSVVSPHVQPYYDQYAAPYVEIARPYYETVDSLVWKPTRAYAVRYGAPWVERGRAQARAQWEKNGQPQLAQLQDLIQSQYDRSVGPYVTQASNAVGPYYEIARTNCLQLYYEYLLPSYEYVHPYMSQGYDLASDFATGTALPGFYWTWNKTYAFLDTAVWPHVRAVYSENVEPQLIRIGERLGRYKTREKGKPIFENNSPSATADAAHSSFSRPPPQSASSISSASSASSASSVLPVSSASSAPTSSEVPAVTESPKSEPEPEAEDNVEDYINPVQAPPPGENESEIRRKAREMVAHDLELWQNKFARQADDGANDIDERVDTIAKRMIRRNARVTGKSLVDGLRSAINVEVTALKAKIISFVESAAESSEETEEQVVTAVRSCGMIIKKKAQAIREWRESYDKELQSTVLSIADIHFQILDETRNLALQQIGMRWAWTDGVTYKDWAKYHELKSTLSEWTEQLKQLIVSHPTLLEAQDASAQVEDEGMEIASAAAKELARLKNVARWKIIARDATENFDSEAMKQAAEAAEAARAQAALEADRQRATEQVSLGDADGVVEEDSKQPISDRAEDVSSTVSAKYEEATSAAEAVVLEAEAELEDFLSLVSEPTGEAASSVAGAAGTAAEVIEEYASATTESASSALFGSGDILSGTLSEAAADASSTIESVFSDASSTASESTETLSSVVDDISKTVEALSTGASESVHSDAGDKPSALSEAISSVIDKADTTKLESIASEASESLAETAKAKLVHLGDDEAAYEVEEDPLTQRDETPPSDTPGVKPVFFGAAAQAVPDRQPILDDYVDTDAIASATDAAQTAYSRAVSRASERYSSAVSVVSAQIYGTPKPVHEQLFSAVSSAYDSAVSEASSKLNDAVEAASEAVPATPTIPTLVDWQRVESIAAQRLTEGRLWAEIQYQSALIALGLATPTPSSPMEKYYEQARLNYYAGLGVAQDRYSSFMAGASSALSSLTASPTPTDIAGSASSVASVARESVASAAQAAGDAAGSVVSAAGDRIASATQAVDDSVSSVVDAANEQISNAGEAVAALWVNVVSEISANVYEQPSQIPWHQNLLSEAGSYAAAATDAAESSALVASEEAARRYAAVSELVSELIVGKEPSFTDSVLSRLGAAYATAAANVESMASEASQAASSIGDNVGSAAGKATDAVKETVEHMKDEL